jgi:hypothetical protein
MKRLRVGGKKTLFKKRDNGSIHSRKRLLAVCVNQSLAQVPELDAAHIWEIAEQAWRPRGNAR